ncbi:hypothetical protein Ae201684_007514 [Aphanomyces euteiches]|uniref:Protein kinase domain-containing protein n=1 Tax=Aphanomyces euteiches TaxID=100861 RepID=A0A6G0X9E5_9STRA|nr:hypothetical protein Ae201684_007514 [Aphanomyces euteiches]KAH9132050.1 hypothetical protein AeRB84_021412 [Aphanomyces euteiches]
MKLLATVAFAALTVYAKNHNDHHKHHHKDLESDFDDNINSCLRKNPPITIRQRAGLDELVVNCTSGQQTSPLQQDLSISLEAASSNVATSVVENFNAWIADTGKTTSQVESITLEGSKSRPAFDFRQDFTPLSHVKFLSISRVRVPEISPNTINFKSLRSLTCRKCNISRLILPETNVLKSVTLDGNPAISLISEKGWSTVTSISLTNNELASFPSWLLNLPSLKYINLRGTSFQSFNLTAAQLDQLNTLMTKKVIRLDTSIASATKCQCGSSAAPTIVTGTYLCACVLGGPSMAPTTTSPPKSPQSSAQTPSPPTTSPSLSTQTALSLQNGGGGSQASNSGATDGGSEPGPSSASTKSSSSKNSTELIVGIVGGIVAVVLVVGIFIFRRHLRKPGQGRDDLAVHLNSSTSTIVLQPPSSMRPSVVVATAPELLTSDPVIEDSSRGNSVVNSGYRVAPEEFVYPPKKLAGTNRYWTSQLREEKVVVRRSHDIADAAELQGFVDSIKFIAQRPHPCLVDFKGVYFDANDGEFCAIVEFMDKRGLGSVLLAPNISLDLTQKRLVAKQVVDAVGYVFDEFESPQLPFCCVNLDLSTKSFLVNAALDCKMNVFQFTKAGCNVPAPPRLGEHKFKWMPPECLAVMDTVECCTLREREPALVFKLGLVLGEIFFRTLCFSPLAKAKGYLGGDTYMLQHVTDTSDDNPLLHPFDWTNVGVFEDDEEGFNLIRACCSRNPHARPSLDALRMHFSPMDPEVIQTASRIFFVEQQEAKDDESVNEDGDGDDDDDAIDERPFKSFVSSSSSRDRLVQSFRSSISFSSRSSMASSQRSDDQSKRVRSSSASSVDRIDL